MSFFHLTSTKAFGPIVHMNYDDIYNDISCDMKAKLNDIQEHFHNIEQSNLYRFSINIDWFDYQNTGTINYIKVYYWLLNANNSNARVFFIYNSGSSQEFGFGTNLSTGYKLINLNEYQIGDLANENNSYSVFNNLYSNGFLVQNTELVQRNDYSLYYPIYISNQDVVYDNTSFFTQSKFIDLFVTANGNYIELTGAKYNDGNGNYVLDPFPTVANYYDIFDTSCSDVPPSDTDKVIDSVNQINDTLNNDNLPSLDDLNALGNYLGDGPVDGILLLPLNLMNTLLTYIGGQCSPITLNIPFVNLPFRLPCFDILADNIPGFRTWWDSFGVLLSGFIMYEYLTHMYNDVWDTLSFNKNRLKAWGVK